MLVPLARVRVLVLLARVRVLVQPACMWVLVLLACVRGAGAAGMRCMGAMMRMRARRGICDCCCC